MDAYNRGKNSPKFSEIDQQFPKVFRKDLVPVYLVYGTLVDFINNGLSQLQKKL